MDSLAGTVMAIFAALAAVGGTAAYKVSGGGKKGLAFGAVGAVAAPYLYVKFMQAKNHAEAEKEAALRARFCRIFPKACRITVDGIFITNVNGYEAWKRAVATTVTTT